MDGDRAKCSVGRKGEPVPCHVTLQLCAPGLLELSSAPASGTLRPPNGGLIPEREPPHGQSLWEGLIWVLTCQIRFSGG